MKFQYSVIGDNTQENREWLEKVGYKPFIWDEWDEKQPYLSTMDDGEYTSIEEHGKSSEMCSLDINCIGNSPLFKAVSAMREDSDYMQWFITDFSNKLIPTEPIYLSETKCFNGVLIPYHRSIPIHEDGFHIGSGGFHKATLTELQERFKEKER